MLTDYFYFIMDCMSLMHAMSWSGLLSISLRASVYTSSGIGESILVTSGLMINNANLTSDADSNSLSHYSFL